MTDVSAFGGFSNALRAHLEDEFLKTPAVIFPMLDRAPLDANHVRFHIVQYRDSEGWQHIRCIVYVVFSMRLFICRAYESTRTYPYPSICLRLGQGRLGPDLRCQRCGWFFDLLDEGLGYTFPSRLIFHRASLQPTWKLWHLPFGSSRVLFVIYHLEIDYVELVHPSIV